MTVFTEVMGSGQATNTETKADILSDIEDAVDRIDEFVDELGREIDLVTDELSEDVADAASDLGRIADLAMHDIQCAFATLSAALADDIDEE